MRLHSALAVTILAMSIHRAAAYVPAKTPVGADRRWMAGTIPVQLVGPAMVDGNAVQDGVRRAMATWSAVAHSRVRLTEPIGGSAGNAPEIGNGINEVGWVEASDSPYFVPGVPCTTVSIYDTISGAMAEADTTCNAMSYQWPPGLFGLASQDNVVDAESAALAAFGVWLGLDASLVFGDPMDAVTGSGRIIRTLAADEYSFARARYGDGTSLNGAISGVARRADGTPIAYAYVLAIGTDNGFIYGSVASESGAYTIQEIAAGTYQVLLRPLTTSSQIVTSVPYRAASIATLDFSPEYFGSGATVVVRNGITASSIDLTASRSGSDPDRNEPNDTREAATPLLVGYSKLGTTHQPFDDDWYTFQTQAGICYAVGTWLHGASVVPVEDGQQFWSRTRLFLYDASGLIGANESRDPPQDDPRNWLTFCESGAGRKLDVDVEQRGPAAGAGFFYSVFVQAIPGGSTVTPSIGALYPGSGWAQREQYVWIDGAGFMPGARVEVRVSSGAWVPSSDVISARCDAGYRCTALKALFPAVAAGAVDVRVTNTNGLSDTKVGAFSSVSAGQGPILDRTPQAFGTRYGSGRTVCIADFDGDGDDDIFKSRDASLPYQLFRNNGDGTFTDVAAESGLVLDPPLDGQSCSFIDIDDDGDLDLYVTNLAPFVSGGSINELYVNQLAETGQARFVRQTPGVLAGGSGRYQTDAAWADFDHDGRLDVVLVDDSYANGPPYLDAIHLLRQTANGSFTDVTSSSGLAGYVAPVTTVKAADFDGDGCDDLALFTFAGASNKLYQGDCHAHFIDRTSASHIADNAPWCTGVAVADFNNDGALDIFCGSDNAGPGPARPRLWINDGTGAFTDRAGQAGLYSAARNMDVVLPLDEDNDGRIDVYIGASENGWPDDRRDVLLRNVGGSVPVFQDVTAQTGMYPTTADGTGICTAAVDEYYCDRDAAAGGTFDWYGDGAQDVFVTGDDPDGLERGSDFLWRNQNDALPTGAASPGNDWIEIELKGANTAVSRVLSNRKGIGARVTVLQGFALQGGAVPTETQCLQTPPPAGVTSLAAEVTAGSRSQSAIPLHFGLGNSMPRDRRVVDCVRVQWPSGLERAYTGLPANTKVLLAEETGRLKVIAVVPNTGANTNSVPTTVLGLRFDRDVSAVPQVYFGSVPARSVTFVSEHELSVLPPLWHVPGIVDVTVVNTDGTSDTLLAAYTFTGSDTYVRLKDPVPMLLTSDGGVRNDPSFVAAHGIERSGVIADGVTRLVVEAVVPGNGSVKLALDDDDDPSDAPTAAKTAGTLGPLVGGGSQTSVTVSVVHVSDGRFVGQAVFVAPAEFLRGPADEALATRVQRIRATYVDPGGGETALPPRAFDVYRVPILFIHGMWADTTTFGWAVLQDPRFIVHLGDYSLTSDAGFAQNEGVAPRTIAELRKVINDRGIAGTRFFVVGHSMGALLFKIYMGGAGAPYARADNFFMGDVHALIAVDAPFFGSYLATFSNFVASLGEAGAALTAAMGSIGLHIDRGCASSLDPTLAEIPSIPQAVGAFHVVTGWGGREMRAAGVQALSDVRLDSLAVVLASFGFDFDTFLLRCGPGDDFVVCTDSQEGGLSGGAVDDFHFVDLSNRAIHFNSIARESEPGTAVEQLLNTSTGDGIRWSPLLPPAPPIAALARSRPATVKEIPPPPAVGGLVLSAAKQGDGVVLNAGSSATRLWKSLAPSLTGGVCLAMTWGSYLDAHALTTPASSYYSAGTDALCAPTTGLSVASLSPSSGPAGGGYTVSVLGSGFAAGDRVRIGDFYADGVQVVSGTLITFRMMPGRAGPVVVSVAGDPGVATGTFTYLGAPTPIGSVRITGPAPGSAVTAGSTLTIRAEGADGFVIDRALVTGGGLASSRDDDSTEKFATTLQVPDTAIGPLTIELWAHDAGGRIQSAAPLTLDVVAPGNIALLRIEAGRITMLYDTPALQLHVFGIYSDGARREVTHAQGISFEMDTQDPRKPNYPYNGTGIATVGVDGVVSASTCGTTVCHVSYQGRQVDVVVEVAQMRPTVSVMKPGLISWPYQGSTVTYDVIRGRLSGLRASGGRFDDPSTSTTCLKNDFANVSAADVALPPASDGFFYLMRDSGTGSYDESPFWRTRSQRGRRTDSITAASGGCP